MNTQHTPGHWVWGPNARRYADPNLPECQRVMNVHLGKTTALCWDERDARLIAAAPELLHALQMIDSNAAESVEWIRRVARAAIAKATGETA